MPSTISQGPRQRQASKDGPLPSRGSLTLQEPERAPVDAVSAEPWFMLFIPLTPYCLVPLQGLSSVCSPSFSLLIVDTPSQTHGTEKQCMRRSGPCHCQLESRIKSHVGWQMQDLRKQEEERRRQGFAADTEAPGRLFFFLFRSHLEVGPSEKRTPCQGPGVIRHLCLPWIVLKTASQAHSSRVARMQLSETKARP